MLGMTVCFSTLWRFPYQVANFGGAAFILIYLLLAVLLVFPALTAEWSLGRLTGSGPEAAYGKKKVPGAKLITAGLFCVVLTIGSYFAVWIGWIVRYAISSLTDPALLNPSTDSNAYFDTVIAPDAVLQLLFAGIVILFVAPTILGGTRRIEVFSRRIVPIFFGLVLIMTVSVLLQPGVLASTLNFFLSIDIGAQVTPFTFVAALGQAFFSLCLGGTYMVLYASYMERKSVHDIPVNAALTVAGNTIASLISAFLVFGIIFMSGLNVLNASGPGLFFGVIPEGFQSLGEVMGPTMAGLGMAIFFTMFFFSAYMPLTAILHVTVTMIERNFHLERKFAYATIAGLTFLLAIPSVLSPLQGGFLYNVDIFVGAIGSVLGSMAAIIAFTWFTDKRTAMSEVNAGSRVKLGNIYHFVTKYVAPLFMLFVVFYALADVVGQVAGLNSSTDYILYTTIVEIIPFTAIIFVVVALLLAIGNTILSKRIAKSL